MTSSYISVHYETLRYFYEMQPSQLLLSFIIIFFLLVEQYETFSTKERESNMEFNNRSFSRAKKKVNPISEDLWFQFRSFWDDNQRYNFFLYLHRMLNVSLVY